MATLEEKRQFYANNPKKQTIIHMSGKRVAFVNFPKEEQKKIMDRLAEKDEVQKLGQKGVLPGIKIGGKQVTRENIHEFEKGAVKVRSKEIKEIEKYTKEELQEIADKKGLKGLRKIGTKLGLKFRGVKEAIKEILNIQK